MRGRSAAGKTREPHCLLVVAPASSSSAATCIWRGDESSREIPRETCQAFFGKRRKESRHSFRNDCGLSRMAIQQPDRARRKGQLPPTCGMSFSFLWTQRNASRKQPPRLGTKPPVYLHRTMSRVYPPGGQSVLRHRYRFLSTSTMSQTTGRPSRVSRVSGGSTTKTRSELRFCSLTS